MEFQKIKTQIIDEIINPFLIKNGFIKEGKYYFINKNHIIILVELSCQEYHKDVIIENFLINIKVFLDNSYELLPFMYFESYNIDFPEISWIRIIEIMDIDKLTLLLKYKLEELLVVINEYNSIEKIIEKGKEEIIKTNLKIMEIEKQLETQTNDQSLNDVLKISLKLNEEKIKLLKDWIQKRLI